MIGGDLPEQIEVYMRIGRSSVRLLEESLASLDRGPEDVRAVLDLGCGYGRVTRQLVRSFDAQAVSVFDVDPGAAEFCEQEFGVNGLSFKDRWDWSAVPFATYDVVWAGSVFTHLSESFARETLSVLSRITAPAGMLVFTTHGPESLSRVREGFYGDRCRQLADSIVESLGSTGFCFVPYTRDELAVLPFTFQRPSDFGLSWHSEARIRALIAEASHGRLEVVDYRNRGWESHQDVVVCRRLP